MDFNQLIAESNLDMMIRCMMQAVDLHALDTKLLAENCPRLIQRFLDELNRPPQETTSIKLFLGTIDVPAHCQSDTIGQHSSTSSLPSVQLDKPAIRWRPEATGNCSSKSRKRRFRRKRRSVGAAQPPPLPGPTVTYCTFCKNNGVEPSIYNSHVIKDPITKKVVCPTLRNYTCPYCHNKNKDFAHTRSHCPKWAADQEVASQADLVRK